MNLDQYMRQNGWSNRKAAKSLGCNREQVSSWRRGLYRPGRDWWRRLEEWSGGQITEDVPSAKNRE